MAPVTSSGSATLDGAVVTPGCWTIRVRPSVKPITIAEPTTALAAARTVVLRITMFPVSEAISMHSATVIRKNWLTFGCGVVMSKSETHVPVLRLSLRRCGLIRWQGIYSADKSDATGGECGSAP